MDLKQQICRAFCDNVEVSRFAGGFSVGTAYRNRSGDKIGVYALGPKDGRYRLVDNALTVAFIEAEGATFDNQGRRNALNGLLEEYGASYDEEMGEIYIDGVGERDLPKAILNFSALLLRMNDLLLLTPERAESTFKEDIKEIFRKRFAETIRIVEDQPVSESLQEISPDMTFFPEGRMPVALFIATSEARLWQAMHLRLIADYEQHYQLSVVAILQADNSVGQKVRSQADNRLDAVPRYESEPNVAIQRVVKEIVGPQSSAIH